MKYLPIYEKKTNTQDIICYESLNDNLRLVLLTQGSEWNSDA